MALRADIMRVTQMRRVVHGVLNWAASRIEPRAPHDLEQRLAHGDIVWQAFLDAGRALVRAGRFDEADGALQRALAMFPDDRVFLVEYAMSAHQSGRYGLAADRWTAALAIAPDVAMCHGGLAANRRMLGDNESATRVIKAALALFPADLTIITEAARCAEHRAAFAAALALWETATATTNPHPEWMRGRANALFALGRRDEAQAVLADALKRHPIDQPLRDARDRMAEHGTRQRGADF